MNVLPVPGWLFTSIFPTVRLHDELHAAQPQPDATCLARQVSIHLVEPAKTFFCSLGEQADAIIGHREADAPGFTVSAQVDSFLCRRKLVGVVHRFSNTVTRASASAYSTSNPGVISTSSRH